MSKTATDILKTAGIALATILVWDYAKAAYNKSKTAAPKATTSATA